MCELCRCLWLRSNRARRNSRRRRRVEKIAACRSFCISAAGVCRSRRLPKRADRLYLFSADFFVASLFQPLFSPFHNQRSGGAQIAPVVEPTDSRNQSALGILNLMPLSFTAQLAQRLDDVEKSSGEARLADR